MVPSHELTMLVMLLTLGSLFMTPLAPDHCPYLARAGVWVSLILTILQVFGVHWKKKTQFQNPIPVFLFTNCGMENEISYHSFTDSFYSIAECFYLREFLSAEWDQGSIRTVIDPSDIYISSMCITEFRNFVTIYKPSDFVLCYHDVSIYNCLTTVAKLWQAWPVIACSAHKKNISL